MVKSKKMSKGSLAIIILAVLLVLSMVLGLTGAWFTDKATGSSDSEKGNVQFGTVNIKVDSTNAGPSWTKCGETKGVANTYIVPGSEATGSFVISNVGTEDVWYKVSKAEFDLKVGEKSLKGVDGITIGLYTDSEYTVALDTTTVGSLNNEAAATIYFKLTIDGTKIGNTVTVGGQTVVLNDTATDAATPVDATLTYSIEVSAVQKANNTEHAGL